jgi:hypothetical protein
MCSDRRGNGCVLQYSDELLEGTEYEEMRTEGLYEGWELEEYSKHFIDRRRRLPN